MELEPEIYCPYYDNFNTHFPALFAPGLFLAASAIASPTPTNRTGGSGVKPRQSSPYSYPGGDSPECTNETQYLNFDTSDATQLEHVQAIHRAFCTGFGQLVHAGGTDLGHEDNDLTVYDRYFSEDLELQSEIGDVYFSLVDIPAFDAKPVTADMIIDNNDFLGLLSSDPFDGDSSEESGYQGTDSNGDQLEKFHLCDAAFTFPDLPSDTDCTALSDHPDQSMESLARLILHEILHYTTVGNPIFGSQIIDMFNEDDLHAYYPQRVHALVDPNQDAGVRDSVTAQSTVMNADSYGWHATNAYYKFACKNVREPGPNNGNWNDPPNYTPGNSGDN